MRILLFPPNHSPHLFARQRNADCFSISLHNNTHNPKLSVAEGIWVYNSHPEHSQKLHMYPNSLHAPNSWSKLSLKLTQFLLLPTIQPLWLRVRKTAKWLHRVKQFTGWWLGRSSAFNHWSHPLSGKKWPKEVLHSISPTSMHASKQHRNGRIKCALLCFYITGTFRYQPLRKWLKWFCSSKQVSCTLSGQRTHAISLAQPFRSQPSS